jgi:hypothetical protein
MPHLVNSLRFLRLCFLSILGREGLKGGKFYALDVDQKIIPPLYLPNKVEAFLYFKRIKS